MAPLARTLLVVDGDARRREALELGLAGVFERVIACADGRDVAGQGGETRPDAIVAALATPHLSLDALAPAEGAPLIAIGDPARREEALAAGAAALLPEDAFVRDVLVTLSLAFARRRAEASQPAAPVTLALEEIAPSRGLYYVVRALHAARRSALVLVERRALGEPRRGGLRLVDGDLFTVRAGRHKGGRALEQLLLWDRATVQLSFVDGGEDEARRIGRTTERLLAEGIAFADDIGRAAARVGGLATVYRRDEARVSAVLARIPKEVRAFLDACDGRRPLLDLLDDSPFKPFDALVITYRLVELGAIVATAPDAPEQPAAPPLAAPALVEPPPTAARAPEPPPPIAPPSPPAAAAPAPPPSLAAEPPTPPSIAAATGAPAEPSSPTPTPTLAPALAPTRTPTPTPVAASARRAGGGRVPSALSAVLAELRASPTPEAKPAPAPEAIAAATHPPARDVVAVIVGSPTSAVVAVTAPPAAPEIAALATGGSVPVAERAATASENGAHTPAPSSERSASERARERSWSREESVLRAIAALEAEEKAEADRPATEAPRVDDNATRPFVREPLDPPPTGPARAAPPIVERSAGEKESRSGRVRKADPERREPPLDERRDSTGPKRRETTGPRRRVARPGEELPARDRRGEITGAERRSEISGPQRRAELAHPPRRAEPAVADDFDPVEEAFFARESELARVEAVDYFEDLGSEPAPLDGETPDLRRWLPFGSRTRRPRSR